jgi:hypothetical protein
MRRAAILVLVFATLVTILSPSANPLASSIYPTKSGSSSPSVIAPRASILIGPATTGGGTGGGNDQGDADGLSGLKVKPITETSNFAVATFERMSTTMMMWWRLMALIR